LAKLLNVINALPGELHMRNYTKNAVVFLFLIPTPTDA